MKTEIIPNAFSNYNGMKLKMNYKKAGKFANMWILNNMLCNNQWVKEETKRTSKNTPRQIKMKIYQNLWNAVKAGRREKFIMINAYIKK